MQIAWMVVTVLLLMAPSGATAQDPILPMPQPGEKLSAIVSRQDAHFATVGTGRGTGYRQFKRWEWLMRSRSYPSGSVVNITALAWLGHFGKARTNRFSEQMAAGVTAGVGNGNWRSLGPTRYIQGQSGYNGGIGRINAVAFDPIEPQTVYVGAPVGGLWRSDDAGASWAPLTDGLPVIGVSDIAIDRQDPKVIYILTGDGDGQNVPSIGVVKSTDNGRTWQPTALAWKRDQVQFGYRLAIDHRASSTVLAATTAGLFRTVDGGKSWSTVANEPFADVVFHPTDSSIVYASSRNTVHRSTDNGQTWSRLTTGLPISPRSDRIRLAVSPASPNILYVLYGGRTGFAIGLYRSADAGNTFTMRSNSPNILGYEQNGSDSQSQSYYDLALAVSSADAERVHVGGVNTWRSDDGGATWRITSHWIETGQVNYTHADIHALAYKDDILYAGTDGGIYRSTNGGDTWANITPGLAITQLYQLCGTPQDANLLYFGAQDNGSNRYLLGGQAMTQIFGADGFQCQIHPTDSRIVYFSTQNGGLRRSDDSGNTSVSIAPAGAGSGPWLTPYSLAPPTHDTIYACYTDLWRSRNRGATWVNLTVGLLGSDGECRQVVVAPSDLSTLYVAKGPDQNFVGSGVFRSSDGGATWQAVTGSLPVDRAAITNLAVSPTDANRIWVTFSGYDPTLKVFTSRDGGITWTNISTDMPNLPVNTIVAQNAPTNGVYVGMDVGVYYRDDRLNTWIPFMNGMPNVIVNDLMIDEARQKIRAGTYGRGIWESDVYAPCPDMYEFTASTAPPIVGVTVFQAQKAITSAISLPGSLTIDVTYRAGERIQLLPGFSVGVGARFKASTGSCRGTAAAVAAVAALGAGASGLAPFASISQGLAPNRRVPTVLIPYSGPLDFLQ